MPVTDAYSDAATYRNRITKSDTGNDAAILSDLGAISRYLDQKLNRFFTQDASFVARRFYPSVDYQRTLFVDDIASKAGLIVKVDDNRDGVAEVTLTEVTDFELLPLNAAFGPEPSPWNSLYIPPRTSRNGWWSMVEVTAKFGWPAIPPAIARATEQLTAILRLETPRATQRVPEAIDHAFATSHEAQDIVQQLAGAYSKPVWL